MFRRQKLFKHKYTKMLHILFPLVCVKYIFFWFIEVFDSKLKNVSERARITSLVGEKNTVLKIAVDSVTLELCDSRDYFASSLLLKKTD